MMKDIYGTNFAPLVLKYKLSHSSIALSDYANAHRTVGASLLLNNVNKQSTNGAESLTLGKARGMKTIAKQSTNGAKSKALGNAQGTKDKIPLSTNGAK